MRARRLDGSGLAARLEREIREQVECGAPSAPVLAALAAEDPLARRFLDLKRRACERVGIELRVVHVSGDASTSGVPDVIDAFNDDAGVDAIFVQAPLSPGVSLEQSFERIDPEKDVDACGSVAARRLADGDPLFVPATPAAIMQILRHHGIGLEDVLALVVGGTRVATATAELLRQAGASVRIGDPATARAVSEAELLVAATGVPESIPGDWVRDGAIVVDAGYDHGGGRGDIALGEARDRVSAFVPPRGSLGPLTIAMLLRNTVLAWSRGRGSDRGCP